MIERRLGAGLTTFAIAAAIFVAAPAGAGAATSCSFAGSTATVTMTTTNDAATLGRSGNAIQVNGVNCGAATVTNTDLISVVGTPDSGQRVAVDLTGGALAPGLTAEGARARSPRSRSPSICAPARARRSPWSAAPPRTRSSSAPPERG